MNTRSVSLPKIKDNLFQKQVEGVRIVESYIPVRIVMYKGTKLFCVYLEIKD